MRLNLLGPLELLRNGQPVDAGRPKQRALLALLAMHADRVVPVDTLMHSLWSGSPPDSAQGSIQVYVSKLRRLLEPGRSKGEPATVLVSGADGYGLITGDDLTLDVRQFSTMLARAQASLAGGQPDEALRDLEEGLALWRGEAYADVRLEEWAQPEITRLDELRVGALEDHARALLELGRTAQALAELETFVERHPLRESGWELLALGRYRLGHQAEALAALRRVRELLADELGIDPSPRLRDLESAILRQDAVLSDRAKAERVLRLDQSPRRQAQPPAAVFVGRVAELGVLSDAAEDARTAGVLVLVEGEPGIGKTALVREFARQGDLPVLWGSSPDHETAPALWPWEQVLRGLAAHNPRLPIPRDVASFLSDELTAVSSYDVEGARLRFFEAVRGYLSEGAPLLVVLDDLHAADAATLRLLVHLAATPPRGVLLVGIYRRHEAAGLTASLSSLARHGARRLSLDGLEAEETTTLLRELGATEPTDEWVSRLQQRTDGNPFLLTELARHPDHVPASVHDVLLTRIAGLGEPVTQLLEIAAVAGDEFDVGVVAEVAGSTVTAASTLLDIAYAAGVVRESATRLGSYSFAHSLVTDALMSRRSRLWQAMMHQRHAEVASRKFGDDEDRLGDIARHWLAAAELGPKPARKAMEYAARTAGAALARHAPEDATLSWQEAIAAADLAGADQRERAQLAVGLAESYYLAGRFEDGYEAACAALALAPEPVEVVRIADIAMGYGIWLPFPWNFDPADLRDSLARAVAGLDHGSPAWALGRACEAVIKAQTGNEVEVDATSAEAVTAAEHVGDQELLNRVLHLRLVAMRGVDFVEQRAQTATQLLAQPTLPAELAVIAEMQLASHCVETGRVTDARALLEPITAKVQEAYNPTLLLQAAIMRAGLALFESRYDEAFNYLQAVRPMVSAADERYFQAALLSQRLQAEFEQGRLHELIPLIEEVFQQSGIPGFAYALALGLTDTGDVDKARQLVSTPMPPRDWSWIASAVIRLLAALQLDEQDTIAALREELRPFAGQLVVSGAVTQVYGAYDGLIGEADLALGDREAARRHLASAVRVLERNGAGYWLVRARQALANCS